MPTNFFIALMIVFGVLLAVGSAGADSQVNYPDGTASIAISLGGGSVAFVYISNDLDYFIHPSSGFGSLIPVTVNSFNGFGFLLFFEGFNQGLRQYGVYSCLSSNLVVCNIPNVRRGTLFLS